MTSPNARRAKRSTPRPSTAKRYRLTPAGHAWLEHQDAQRLSASADHVARANRAALAQLRTVNNALIVAGLYRPRIPSKP